MTLLLDTHALLWFLKNDPQLGAAAKAAIEDPANRKLVSIASCWEIAIKAGLGKLKLGEPAAALLSRELPANSFDLLPISLALPLRLNNCRRTTKTHSTGFWSHKRCPMPSSWSAATPSSTPTASSGCGEGRETSRPAVPMGGGGVPKRTGGQSAGPAFSEKEARAGRTMPKVAPAKPETSQPASRSRSAPAAQSPKTDKAGIVCRAVAFSTVHFANGRRSWVRATTVRRTIRSRRSRNRVRRPRKSRSHRPEVPVASQRLAHGSTAILGQRCGPKDFIPSPARP